MASAAPTSSESESSESNSLESNPSGSESPGSESLELESLESDSSESRSESPSSESPSSGSTSSDEAATQLVPAFPQFCRLPAEIQTMVFRMAAEEYSSTLPILLTLAQTGLYLREGLDRSLPYTALVRMYRRPEVHAALRSLTELCHASRRAMLGRETVMFDPRTWFLRAWKGTFQEPESNQCTPYPILSSATRDVVMKDMSRYCGVIGQIDAPAYMGFLTSIVGNKVKRLHLLNESWPDNYDKTMNITVPETGRVYQLMRYAEFASLEVSIKYQFGKLPDLDISWTDGSEPVASERFEDSDAKVFDITSADHTLEAKRRCAKEMYPWWTEAPTPRTLYGEIMRMRRDGTIEVNAGVAYKMQTVLGLPRVMSKLRLQQMMDLAVKSFPELEHISILGRLAKPQTDEEKKAAAEGYNCDSDSSSSGGE